jgi:hypothetical protein
MQKVSSIFLAIIAWFAVMAQFVLMMQNRSTSIPETIVRFFSFFTILTNILVGSFFAARSLGTVVTCQPGNLTAITVYIFIVGVVYQVLLRHLWQPSGLQFVVDELLHSAVPLLTLLFWYFWENKRTLRYSQVTSWLIYPMAYLIVILVRGHFSGFYPYPFVDVIQIGLSKTLLNIGLLVITFIGIGCLFIAIGKEVAAKKSSRDRIL